MPHYKTPATLPELRQRIFTNIDKLSDRSTLSLAVSDLKYLATTLPSDSLPIFLSSILAIDSSSKSSVRVHCINILSLLAKTHKNALFSYVQKPIIPFLIRRLRDSDSAVRTACATAAGDLSPVGFSSLFWAFVGAVMTEQEVNAQMGSCVCLKSVVDSAVDVWDSDEGELRRVLPKLVKIVRSEGFKAKAGLLGVIESIVRVNDGNVVKNYGGLVQNVVNCGVDMLSFGDWTVRKSAAEVLEAVAVVADEGSVMEVKRFVVSSLESRRFDKVKITRETMNRALNAWKDVAGGPEEDLLLSRSNSSRSKDYGSGGNSPPASRRLSFGGLETPKPKKTLRKAHSSFSSVRVAPIPSSLSPNNDDVIGFKAPQKKKTTSKGRRSYLSDESTITDSSSVSISKSSHDCNVVTLQPMKPTPKSVTPLLDDGRMSAFQNKNCLDRDTNVLLHPTLSVNVVSEDDMETECKVVEIITSGSETKTNFNKTTDEMMQEVRGLRSGSRVVPFIEEEESLGLIDASEEVMESNTDVEDLSMIRNQLLQIEKRQSTLLDLLQRFMGNSQNGINSLETRVSGLERALDEISYDLAVQSGRIPNNVSAASTCCPSTEFWSPKFWRRTEGRSSMSKFSCLGNVPNKVDSVETLRMDSLLLHKQKDTICRDLRGGAELDFIKSVNSLGQNTKREKMPSPRY